MPLWHVEDGILIGSGPHSHLFSERGDYENFRYRVEAMINDHGNSGQYFRTAVRPRLPQGLRGPDQQHARRPIRSGSLYPSFGPPKEDRDKIIIKERLVTARRMVHPGSDRRGNHIVIKVNGKTTVDYVDAKNTLQEGPFRLAGTRSGHRGQVPQDRGHRAAGARKRSR